MKILLFTHYYPPELGAPQRRWSGLVSRWQKAGHEVTIYCPSPHYPDRNSTQGLRNQKNKPWVKELGSHGETIRRMPYILHGYSGGVRLVDQFFTALISGAASLFFERRGSYDVVISTVPGLASAYAAQMYAKVHGIPNVLELRDAWPDILVGDAQDTTGYSIAEKAGTSVKAFVARALARGVRRTQHRADMLVTTTYAFARILENRGLKNVVTVTNGADPQELMHAIPHLEKKREKIHLQYLGTTGRSQGLTVVLRALKELKKRSLDSKVELRIIGEGADLPHLKSYAEKNCLTNVKFEEPVHKKDLPIAYSWADIHLVSLRKAKVFEWTVPSKIFELIATKRRIIGLVDGEASRLIQHTQAGTVLEPGNSTALADEIQKMIESPELRKVSARALEILQTEYSYDVLAPKYIEYLEQVIQTYKSR